MDVLDGTHATDRVQVENIERFASPWSYYVYQDGGVTYARRGDTGRAEFSDASNPRNPIQSALDTAYAAYGRCVIYLAPQVFTFPVGAATSGANNAVINIGTLNGATAKSNISIIGAGMDKTFLMNAKIHKNNTTPTSNVLVSDLTLDAGANPIPQTTAPGTPAADNTTGFSVACSFDSWSSNFRLIRVKLQNSRQELLNWTRMDRALFDDCYFMNGGLGGAGVLDNCPGSQQYYTDATETARSINETIFRNCYFYKSAASRGGFMLSTGRTGNLLITGCEFYNDDSTATGGFVSKNSAAAGGLVAEIIIAYCRGIGTRMGIEVGDSSGGTAFKVDKALIYGNSCNDVIAARKADDVIIANNFVYDTHGTGFIVAGNQRSKIHNCAAKNTNVRSSNTSADTEGGVFVNDCKYTEIHHVTVYDTRETRTSTTLNPRQTGVLTTPFGISVTASSLVAGSVIMIDNCNLLGDISGSAASPFWFVGSDATTTGTAMRIRNHDEVIINGGRVKGATSPAGDSIRLVTNTAAGVSIREVSGYNALGPASVSVTASPFTYTNNDGVPEVLHIFGGTVSNIVKNSITIANTTGTNVWLEPAEAVAITYSSAPTVVKDRR